MVTRRGVLAIVEQIAAAMTKAVSDPELRKIYLAAGFEPDRTSGPDQLQEFLRTEIVRWRPVVEASGLKIE